jgi:hypothetical protein
MEDFDIQISMNGMENELSDFTGISKASTISPIRSISSVSAKPLVAVDVKPIEPRQRQQVPKYFSVSRFEGEPTTDNEPKKSWVDTLNTLTQDFKEITDFKTNEQAQADKEQEIAEKGTKYTILGMNPFVAIGISFAIIIGGSYALTKIKAG